MRHGAWALRAHRRPFIKRHPHNWALTLGHACVADHRQARPQAGTTTGRRGARPTSGCATFFLSITALKIRQFSSTCGKLSTMPAAARLTDKVLHNSPHCHAPIHPPAPTPTPVAHPPQPFAIVTLTSPNVNINNLPAATVTSQTVPCTLAPCVPAGPGLVAMGSATVMINGKPAARQGDMVQWPTCVAPIPSPTGKIIPPCSTDVDIGG